MADVNILLGVCSGWSHSRAGFCLCLQRVSRSCPMVNWTQESGRSRLLDPPLTADFTLSRTKYARISTHGLLYWPYPSSFLSSVAIVLDGQLVIPLYGASKHPWRGHSKKSRTLMSPNLPLTSTVSRKRHPGLWWRDPRFYELVGLFVTRKLPFTRWQDIGDVAWLNIFVAGKY